MRPVVVASCLVLSLLIGGPASADAPSPLEAPGAADLLRAAAAQVEAGQYAQAKALLAGLIGAPPSADQEDAAVARFREGDAALQAGDIPGARAAWSEARTLTTDADAIAFIDRMLTTLAVVGSPAGDLTVARTLRGKVPDWSTGTTMVVFWEPWCPHCQRELPELEAKLPALRAKGVDVLGLTGLTRGSTVAEAKALAKAGGLSFPLAVESGEISERMGIEGVPALAVVRDGVIVWRGHPQQLGDAALDRLVRGE